MNEEPTQRSAVIEIDGQEFTVVQQGLPADVKLAPCSFFLTNTDIHVPHSFRKEIVSTDLTTNRQSCRWTAELESDWVRVTPAAGKGAKTIKFIVTPNESGEERRAEGVIAGHKIVITQAGK